jgi:hypothetical protein
MKIFCKDLNRNINKKDCLPDKSSNACINCPEKNTRKSDSPHIPKEIARLYLEFPEQLPPALRSSSCPPTIFPGTGTIDKRICEIIEKFIPPKILNILKKYPKDTIFQIYDTLHVFYVAITYLNEDYEKLAEVKDTYKKVKVGIMAADTLLNLLNPSLSMMEITSLNDIKDRLIKLKKRKLIIYNPVEFLWNAYMPSGMFMDYIESTPIIMPIGSPGNPLFKALQIVIYKLLDTGGNKKQTEKLVADIINCFSENYVKIEKLAFPQRPPPKTLTVKKLTSKDINNALHSS